MDKLPKSMDDAIRNITNKPSKILGQIGSDLLAIIASRVREFAMVFSKKNPVSAEIFSQTIFENISSIDDEKLSYPESQVFWQALEDSTYCIDNKELRLMFAALISNSCNTDYLNLMHPSFSNTLKCMAPYDAILFQRLAQNNGHTTEAVEYSIEIEDSDEYIILHPCIVFTDEYFKNFDMQSLSISALKKLQVIDYMKSEPYKVDEQFTSIDYFKKLELEYSDKKYRLLTRRVQIYLTPYGASLSIACSIAPTVSV